jgi:hypothetical protein
VPTLPQGTQLSDRGTSPGLCPDHCDTASLLGEHIRHFKLHTINDERVQKRPRGRGNRPCESSLPQKAPGEAGFLEERQDLERLPSGGRPGQPQGHPGPDHCRLGAQPHEYIRILAPKHPKLAFSHRKMYIISDMASRSPYDNDKKH